MKLANPAPWVTEDYLARQAANPELSDAAVLQLHGRVWAEGDDAWLPAGVWATRAAGGTPEPGIRVVLGFDGSYRRDATALIGCTLDGHLFVVKVWERPADAPDDWSVPRHQVDAKLAEAMEAYDVVELACDPPGWHREIDEWDKLYDSVVLVFETNQPSKMAPACDGFRSAVLDAGLTHDGDPVLARHLANCVVRESSSGTVITKPDPTRKIDAAVAAVVAFERAMWHAQPLEVPWVETIAG